MRIIRVFFKFLFVIAQILISELAVLAAILSMTETGDYHERIWGGMYDIFCAIYSFFHAIVVNMPIETFMTKLSVCVMNETTAFGNNLKADPRTVFLAFIASIAVWKIMSFLLKIIRRGLLKRRENHESNKKGEKKRKKTEKETLEKLYDVSKTGEK
jgi:hypothetical protein